MYSMKDLSSKLGKSSQSLYSLIKQNQALQSIIKEDSERNGRFISYGDRVLNWFADYYKVTITDEVEQNTEEAEEHNSNSSERGETDENLKNQLQEQNELLRSEVARLREELINKEKQINDLIAQNGNILLLLNQEKAEKQALLPAPKKSIGEKLREIFRGTKAGE